MSTDHDAPYIYAEHLFKLNHGLPLWEPEPTKFGEVLIGDVGYLSDGAFFRLFNALRSRDDPINKLGVPEGFQPLQLRADRLLHERRDAIPPGSLYSKTVQSVDIDIHGNASGAIVPAGAGGQLKFRCTHEQGALLYLDYPAHKQTLHMGSQVTDYIRDNHESWYTFARSEEGGGLRLAKDAIIFVNGFMKTASWSMAAITGHGRSATLAFDAGVGSFASLGADVSRAKKVSVSMAQRQWPLKQPGAPPYVPTFDQCIFLRFHKVKPRLWGGVAVMKGAAGPHDLPRSPEDEEQGGPSSTEIDIEEVPPPLKPYDPVGYVLDYILESSDADIAIASDAGLYALCKEGVPDDIPRFLQQTHPPVYVTNSGVGMLLCEETIEEMMARDSASLETESKPAKAPQDVEYPSQDEESPPIDRPVVVLEDHVSGVSMITTLACSADGKYVVGGTDNGTLLLWNARTGHCIFMSSPNGNAAVITVYDSGSGTPSTIDGLAHTEAISCVDFSPVVERPAFVSGGEDYRVILWDVTTKERVALLEHEEGVLGVQYSPDGMLIATASGNCKVRLWDSATGRLVRTMAGESGIVQAMAFSADGKRLASGSIDHYARIWDVDTGRLTALLEGHEDPIWTVAFSPDGRRLVTGSDDGTSRIWSVESGEALVILGDSTGPVWSAAFSPDGRRVFTALHDSSATLYDSFDGQKISVIEGRESTDHFTAVYSPDGTKVVSSPVDTSLRLCDADTGKILGDVGEHAEKISLVRYVRDGTHVVSLSEDGQIQVWNLRYLHVHPSGFE